MTRIFVTTGAESSGKTTLARELSATLGATLVLEASRDYLNEQLHGNANWRYGEADLLAIAQLQYQHEQNALAASPAYLVCDTDLLVIVIWSEVRYGRCASALRHLFEQSLLAHPRRYLLCDPGIPWQYDPLRENPHDRDVLHARYQQHLQQLALDWRLVHGSRTQRLEQALHDGPWTVYRDTLASPPARPPRSNTPHGNTP